MGPQFRAKRPSAACVDATVCRPSVCFDPAAVARIGAMRVAMRTASAAAPSGYISTAND